jgi:carbonic anhydrase
MYLLFKNWRQDLSSSLVVFFVALPLCLGIGLASTTVEGMLPSPLTGLIAGIIGGIVVAGVSGSRLGVSGPAAGLITIVIAAIGTLGSFEGFLTALILAGLFQMVFSVLKAGIIASYLPSGVIKGMLAAIGITLILKEIPHLVGYDKDYFGDESFFQMDGHNTLSELVYSFGAFDPGIALIGLLSLLLLWIFDQKKIKTFVLFKYFPPLLVVIIIGTLLNVSFGLTGHDFEIAKEHMVQIPKLSSWKTFKTQLFFPDFSFFLNYKTYLVALTIASIASLETLLSVEAIDRQDPIKAVTPTNRELFAQGLGNIISGFVGGLPVTQVIVRSTANLNAGGTSKLSAIFHGFWLILAVFVFSPILNKIPLATLAAILIMVGYKLTNLKLLKQQFSKGWDQFIPFAATIVGILLTDLLKGIGIGLVVAVVYILKRNFKSNHEITVQQEEIEIKLGENVNFLNIAHIKSELMNLQDGCRVKINSKKSKSLDYDIQELLSDFIEVGAKTRNIKVTYEGIPLLKS